MSRGDPSTSRKSPRLSNRLSNALTAANVIGTLLVVAIHYTSREAEGGSPGFNFLLQQLICNGLARVAVPFFAFASGLFLAIQYAKAMPYSTAMGKRAQTILVPYLLASLLFMIFLHGSVALAGRNLPADPATLAGELVIRPLSFQFWFLRDLMVLMLLSPLLVHRTASISWVGGCVLLVAWLIDFQPFPIVHGWYLLNIETLCFFWIGAAFVHRIDLLEKLVRRSRPVIGIAVTGWMVLTMARVAVDPHFDNWYARAYSPASLLLYKFSILIGIAALILISSTVKNSRFLALQSLTFFVFLFHEYPLRYVLLRVMGSHVESQWTFYIAFPVALLILFVIGRGMQRYVPDLYNVLTGGRNSRSDRSIGKRVAGLAGDRP